MKKITIYFWLRLSAISKKTGLAPVFCRISFGKNDETDLSTNFKVNPKNWNNQFKQVFGLTEAPDINKQLSAIKNKIEKIYAERSVLDLDTNSNIIKNIYLGKGEFRKWTLIDIIDEHNEKYKIGIDTNIIGYTCGTLLKYERLKNTIIDFLRFKYNRTDKFLSELNYEFIENFVFYLSTKNGLAHETIRSSYFGKLKKIINQSLNKGRLKSYPFGEFTMVHKEEINQSSWLSLQEIMKITNYRFKDNHRLEKVRHRIVLSMFTGLSYIDLETLNTNDIKIDITGFKYIDKVRKKSNTNSIIPIISEIEPIIQKYSLTANTRGGKLLPKLSNKCYGDYLTEILTIVGINKKTTPHKLRHSYAQASLEAGASIEAVSKMLGHKSTRTTGKYYVQFNKNLVYNAKDALQDRLNTLKQKANNI